MLFPLNQNIQGQDTQLVEDVHESLDSVVTKNNDTVKVTNDKPKGPMTPSRTEQLMKGNILMSKMFDQDFTFVPSCNNNTEIQASGNSLFEKFLNFIFSHKSMMFL